jgi:hypothetical protein
MQKEEYERLLIEIGGGGSETGAEADAARRKGEDDVQIGIFQNYGGCFLFGDALYQFYMDMLRDIVPRMTSETPQHPTFFVHWHVLMAMRFYAAFDLFKRGYVQESSSLSRALWETAVTMAALKRGIVNIDEVFGGPLEPGTMPSARALVDAARRSDSKIQRVLIWENHHLDEVTRSAIESFLNIMNNATHKAKAGLALNLRRQHSGQPIPLFPHYDPKLVEASWNILFLSTWCLMVTLSYLGNLLPAADKPLTLRYKTLLALCVELNQTPPNTVVAGFGNVVKNVFDIPQSIA